MLKGWRLIYLCLNLNHCRSIFHFSKHADFNFTSNCNFIFCRLDEEIDSSLIYSNSFVLDCIWQIQENEIVKHSVLSSGMFGYKDQDFFSAKLFLRSHDQPIVSNTKRIDAMEFYSFQLERIGYKIDQVSFTVSSWPQTLSLTPMSEVHNEVFQKYEIDTPGIFFLADFTNEAFSITFHLKLQCTTNFIYRLIDASWANQLWQSAKKEQFTDVHFVVEEETFHAHRFIVSARSPVFAAMFNVDMVEAKTGRVIITNDVDATTFRRFLKFLYTGQVNPSAITDKQLFTLADQYQLSTLKDLCQCALSTIEQFTIQDLIKNIS